MRKVLSMLLLIAAVFSNAQTVITLNGTSYSEVTMPRRNVEEVDDGIIVTYYFDNAITQQDLLYPGCVLWKIPGFGLNETVGEPAIPFRWDSFSLPQNTSISLEVLDSSFVDFSMQLSPARPALVENDTVKDEDVLPIVPYNGFFPETLVESSLGNIYRGVPLLDVVISPLQYNYCQQIVRAYKMIRYKITFSSSYRNRNSLQFIDINDNYLSSTTANPISTIHQAPSMGHSSEAVRVCRDYLIITNSTLSPIAQEFAEWKRTLGFRTFVAVNDNWSIQAVKDTVSGYYNNPNHNLYYLLILGDENVVPATEVVYSARHNCITDLYYACMDSVNDIIPDVYYGRIPTDNTYDAEVVLKKIRSYEENPTMDASFYNTGLNCAFFEDEGEPKGYADKRFAQTSEEVLQYLTAQGKTVNRVYRAQNWVTPLCWNNDILGFGDSIPNYLRKPIFDWKGKASEIIRLIDEGAFYVLHRDHGEVDRWKEPHFNREHISKLSNQNKLPVVFSINCLTGRYHEFSTEDCFAEAFLKKADGGCVAIFAATGVSFSGYNDALTTGMFDAIWPSPGLRSTFPGDSIVGNITPTPTPTYELGKILEFGKTRMQETWGALSTKWHKSYTTKYSRELFHLFGDPSMQIITNCPTNIQTPDVYLVDDTIFVHIKDGDARISFYTPSTKQVDTYYGTSIRHKITSYDVNVCISRHNYVPYITNANVYIQNEAITDNRKYLGNIVKIGRNVTDRRAQGDVVVNSSNVSIKGKSVELQSGVKVSKGATLKIDNP